MSDEIRPAPHASPPRQDGRDQFERRVLPLRGELMRKALRMTGDRADAEDLVQDCLLKALSAMHTLEDPERARAHHTHFGLMMSGAAVDLSELATLMRDAVDERGRFSPPIALVEGRLQLPFDPNKALRTLVDSVRPLIGSDEKMAALLKPGVGMKTREIRGGTGPATVAAALEEASGRL